MVCMRRFSFPLVFMFVFSALSVQLRAQEPDLEVVVGAEEFRLGPLRLGMNLAQLKKAVKPEELKLAKRPGPEGTELSAAILWKGTGRELHVVYDEESEGKELLEATIIGKDWKLPGGLRRGMTIEQVERINGQPFKVMGFSWDYAGWANFEEGGLLQQGFSIRFDPGAETDESLSGDQLIPSTNKKLRAAKVRVVEINIHLTKPE